MPVAPRQPAAVARRQWLRDRFAEIVGDAGAPNPETLARDLLAAVDDLGFVLPAGIADPPPPPSSSPSTAEGRARAKRLLADALAAKRQAAPEAEPA